MAREALEGHVGGGGYTDFEFTVTDAWFGISEAYAAKVEGGNETIFCHWIGATTLDGVETMEADGFHPSFMIGDDWEIADGGKSLRWVGNPATPEGSRQFKKWYGRMVTELSNNDALKALPEGQHPFDGEGDPISATPWVGTKWFMVDKKYEWGQGRDPSNHLMPTEYLGKAAAAPAAPTAAPAAAPAPAASPAASNGVLRDQAKALALGAEDHSKWQAAALALPGVAADAALFAEIADPEQKLFAEARA